MNSGVRVDHVSYSYRSDTLTLADISTKFAPAKLSFVTGGSGSGKTTLMRCVNGLIPHSYRRGTLVGEIFVGETRVQSLSLSELSRHVGNVMQEPERQMVAIQVMDEIAFGPENLGVARREIYDRILRCADRLSIRSLLERRIDSLSGGEKQKVAIAGALVMQPSILLFDEPLSSLDPASAREVMDILRELTNVGAAVVITEHRHTYALRAKPDHCVILDNGRIAYDGDVAGLPSMPKLERRSISRADSDGEALVIVEDVSFEHREDLRVLRNVSLNIRRGDIIALLGPNGAGKSTLCRHLAGLYKPRTGRVLIRERGTGQMLDTTQMTAAQIARQVGTVFQNPSTMLFASTLRSEIEFGPRNLGVTAEKIGSNVLAAAGAMKLADRLDESPFALSCGERKRVCVASVLAMDPRILVLDEPTAGQDVINVQCLMDHLLTLRKANVLDAVIFATHDLELANAYANRCLVISGGSLVADSEPAQLFSDRHLLETCRLL